MSLLFFPVSILKSLDASFYLILQFELIFQECLVWRIDDWDRFFAVLIQIRLWLTALVTQLLHVRDFTVYDMELIREFLYHSDFWPRSRRKQDFLSNGPWWGTRLLLRRFTVLKIFHFLFRNLNRPSNRCAIMSLSTFGWADNSKVILSLE